MVTPIIVSSIFILSVVILCLAKPNAGRIFLGLFFLIMAIGVNGSFTFSNPQAYVDPALSRYRLNGCGIEFGAFRIAADGI